VDQDIVLWIVVGTALAFDLTNGFHDTANAVATSISTRALSPRLAVSLAAVLNFVGAFISLEVAATIAKGIVNADLVTEPIVFAGLVGAIAWNLATWYFGLPSSSSHALIGGVVGAAFVAQGADAVYGSGLVDKVIVPALVAPLLAFIAGGIAILVAYRIVGRRRPGPVVRGFRLGQVISASLLALSHGTNDAQKTMGIIFLALVANGSSCPPPPRSRWGPTWAAGGSSARWAAGSSRWTRRRASPPRASARR
jgi:PiT family inorganic phosphate transporter